MENKEEPVFDLKTGSSLTGQLNCDLVCSHIKTVILLFV